MIMGEKIALLRRQRGWSQEELADKLNVSRQSVSKWESGGSIPDLERVIKLAQVFEVSTDYLIRDEIEGAENDDKLIPNPETLRRTVSLDEANDYMDAARRSGRGIAFGVACVILCAVPLLLFYGLWTWDLFPGGEKLAEALGLGLLFLFIAAGAALLILNGMTLSKYDYLEKEDLQLAYGVEGIVRLRRDEFAPRFRLGITLGVCGILLGLIPLVVAGALDAPEGTLCLFAALFLVCIAAAVYTIVCVGIRSGSYTKLLQEGDYTPEKKQMLRGNHAPVQIYWCVITAAYLAVSFLTNRWDLSWIIWPVAGVLFPVFTAIVSAAKSGRDERI